MAVRIRLTRVGATKQPTYRVVVADARSARDGWFIEIIGQYAPRQEPSLVTIDSDRALHWLRNGAQPTEEAAKLLEISGVWDAYAQATGKAAAARPKPKSKAPKAKTVTAAAAAPAPPTEAPAADSPAADAPAEEAPAAEVPAEEAAES